MSRSPVLNKPDFTRRAKRGEFGNTLGSWPSIDAAEAAGFKGPTFWFRGRQAGWPYTETHLPWADRRELMAKKLAESGTPADQILICEDEPPGSRRLIQGNVWWPRSDQFILEYDTSQDSVRAATDRGLTHAEGLAAREILRARLEPRDYEAVLELLETYRDHVVEFTAFDRTMGLLERCIVIWEVRKY
jgi:hypothetical protein